MSQHRDSRSDRFQAAPDKALEGAVRASSEGEHDYFPLLAYAAANRIASRYQRTTLPAKLRRPISAGISWVGQKIAGFGPSVTIEEDAGTRKPADVEFVASAHRFDRIGDRLYLVPVDPLRLALEGAGVATRVLYYRSPPRDEKGVGRIAYKRWSGPARRRDEAGEAASRIVAATIRRLSLQKPVMFGAWLDSIIALTGATRDLLRARWQESPVKGVVVCGGVDPFTAGAVQAARDLGIASFELQHGHLRRFDPRVSASVSGSGLIADHFLVWTSATPLAEKASRIVIGAPLRLMQSPQAERVSPGLRQALDDERRRIAQQLPPSLTRLGLVSRQPGIDIDVAAAEAAEALGIQRLLWRSHPRATAGPNDSLDRLATTAPLGLLMERVTAHFTHSSAAALEAFDVGTPTHFLSKRGRGLMLDAIGAEPDHPGTVEAAIERIAEIIGCGGQIIA